MDLFDLTVSSGFATFMGNGSRLRLDEPWQ
jgi:hypothetical protein